MGKRKVLCVCFLEVKVVFSGGPQRKISPKKRHAAGPAVHPSI